MARVALHRKYYRIQSARMADLPTDSRQPTHNSFAYAFFVVLFSCHAVAWAATQSQSIDCTQREELNFCENVAGARCPSAISRASKLRLKEQIDGQILHTN